MFIAELNKELTGRMLDIWEYRADGLTKEQCENYRQSWLMQVTSDPEPILLKHYLCPGDVLVMSAAIESLCQQYPGEYKISVDTTCKEIWQNNPHIHPWKGITGNYSKRYSP